MRPQARSDDPGRSDIAADAPELAEWLEPAERLLWSGRPPRGLLLRPQDAFLIPFSLLWCGIAVFFEITAMRTDAPSIALLVGAFFVAFGLYFVFGRFLVDAYRRAQTVYAVTDRRVLIATGGWRGQFRSLDLRQLPEITFRPGRKGRGTITFGREWPWWIGMRGWSGTGEDAAPAFEAIDDAAKILRLVRDAQRAAATPG